VTFRLVAQCLNQLRHQRRAPDFEVVNNTDSAVPKLECGKLYHSKFCIFMCGMKWRVLPSCYTEGDSLSPIGPPSNLYILLSISFHIPTRTFIAVSVSDSSVCFTTCTSSGYKGRSGDRVLVGVRFSAPVQTGPGANPASYTTGTGSFTGVKRPGRGFDHPPHLAPRLKKE